MFNKKSVIASILVVIILAINILTVPIYAKEIEDKDLEENIIEINSDELEKFDNKDNIQDDKSDENVEENKEDDLDKSENLNDDIDIEIENKKEEDTINGNTSSNDSNSLTNTNFNINTNTSTNTSIKNDVANTTLENSNVITNKKVSENIITQNITTNENKDNTISDKDTTVTVQATNTNKPNVKYSVHVQNKGWINNKKDSETAGSTGEALRLEAIKLNVGELNNVSIKYQVHVQNIGWQSWKANGELAGTEGRSLRLEAIKIVLDSSEEYSVMYRTHVQNIGWQEWKSDGDISGTEGKGLRLEAIQIKIVNKVKKGNICIEYPSSGMTIYNESTVNVTGWKMSNLKNTTMKAYVDNKQIADNQIKYEKRNDVINTINGYGTSKENPYPGFKFSVNTRNLNPGKHEIKVVLYSANNEVLKQTTTNFIVDKNIHVVYTSHVQNIGWQNYQMDGGMAGTEGQALRVEAMKLKLYNAPSNAKIKYRTHIQNVGWQDWKTNDQLSGTEGRALRIEAIQIKLENLNMYTIEYQVHIQDKGWSGWHIDGETAGTVGEAKRIEAIRIRIVPKYKRRYLGIDVSRYNGNVDWTAVKNSGIDFVMIRVGYRGYGQEGNFALDTKFVENIQGAKKAGLKVGVYFFTQAISEQESIEEANWVIDKIRPYKIDMPVAIDVEFSSESNQNGRADHLDKNTRTILVKRFCEVIQNAGYTPMVYLNIDWAKNYVDMSSLSDYDTWIAHYKNDPNSSPNYSGSYSMWQYTSSGKIMGISGDVDCNICYKTY